MINIIPVETLDRVYRSLGILQNSRIISMEEASFRLSEVKLGIDLNYISLEDFKFNELMVAIQSPFLIDEDDDKTVNEKELIYYETYKIGGILYMLFGRLTERTTRTSARTRRSNSLEPFKYWNGTSFIRFNERT